MSTTIQESTQEETAVVAIVEEQIDAEENVHELLEGEVATEAELEDAEAPAAELGLTAELLLHPFNTPVQALWLCEKLKKELGAEVLYLEASPGGTVIKVSIRTPVPLTDFLCSMAEVAEAWEEAAPQKSRSSETLLGLTNPELAQPANPSKEMDKIVCVAMKPT